MLDIEEGVIEKEATSIVSVAELGRHIRITPSLMSSPMWQELLSEAITDAVDKLDGLRGELNRTLMPRTWTRYLSCFPNGNYSLPLPYPPLIEVTEIKAGSESLDLDDFVVSTGGIVGTVTPKDAWPSIPNRPRAASIAYRAGYEEYPPALKRMVKFLAAHYISAAEATGDSDRRVAFAMDDLRDALRVPHGYDDWGE